MRASTLVAFALLVGCDSAPEPIERPATPPNMPPVEMSDALRNGDSFELLSLDPIQQDGESEHETFHNWIVLGVVPVNDALIRTELLDTLNASIAENYGVAAACFNPRHGIRVERDGKTHEFVICFECAQARWYTDGETNKGFLTTMTPQPTFDRVLSEAGIELAPPAH